MERFTNHSRLILSLSQEVAQELGHVWIEPEHILIAMSRAEGTTAFWVLSDADIVAEKLLPFLRTRIPQSKEVPQFDIELGIPTKRMLELSFHIMNRQGLLYIDATVLLIGLMQLKHRGIEAVLAHFQVEAKSIVEMAEVYLGEDTDDSPVTNQKPKLINNIVQSFQEFFRKKKNDE